MKGSLNTIILILGMLTVSSVFSILSSMQTVELVRLLNSIQNRSVFGNKGEVNPIHVMKAQRGVEVQLCSCLNLCAK